MKKSGDGNLMNIAKRTATAATLAGAAAHLGGGKFANGAVSGAFVHLFNGESTFSMKVRVKNILQVGFDTNQEFNAHFRRGHHFSLDLVDGTYTVSQNGVRWHFSGTNVEEGSLSFFRSSPVSVELSAGSVGNGHVSVSGTITSRYFGLFDISVGYKSTFDFMGSVQSNSGFLGDGVRSAESWKDREEQINCLLAGC